MTLLKSYHPMHSKLGNCAHVITLISTLSFALLVARSARDETDAFFDPEWKKHGFCVTNADVPYWNSHDMCFYVDSVSAILLALLYLAWRKTPGLERANEIYLPNVIGILAHGLAHGLIGKSIRDNNGEQGDDIEKTSFEILEHKPPSEAFSGILILLVFWIGLIKASLPNFSFAAVTIFSVMVMLVQIFFVPQYFGFTFVQTVLMMMFSLNQLRRQSIEKEFAYATYAMMVGVPITLLGWMESTQCTTFVRETLYGHLAYDGFIPGGMLMWYVLCYWRQGLNDYLAETLKQKGKNE